MPVIQYNMKDLFTKDFHKIILFIFGFIYFVIVICNHYLFRTYAYDYGNYNFAFYDYAHFRISENTIYHIPHINFLQDHVSFTLMLFIPLYWLLSGLTGTYTLLLIQILVVLYGAWGVYKIILFKTNKRFIALLALLQYLFILGRWTSFTSDCNLAIIASSMVPVFIYYFETKKIIPALIVFIFIITAREDMAIWTAFIGIFFLISHIKEKRYLQMSVAVIILSVTYFITVFAFIIPNLENQYKKFSLFNYSALGNNPYDALIFIITHPIETVKLLFVNYSGNPRYNDLKPEFYIYYLSFGGFLLVFRPKYLLFYIPIIAKKMLNDEPIRWSVELYYSIEFVSILPITTFLIIDELKNKIFRNIMIGLVCFTSVLFTVYGMHAPNRRLNWWGDYKYAFYKRSFYEGEFNVRKVHKYLKQIPSNANVSATGIITPHLAFREKIYMFPRIEDSEYIVLLQIKKHAYPLREEQFEDEVNKYKNNSAEWKIIVNDYPLLILKKIIIKNHIN